MNIKHRIDSTTHLARRALSPIYIIIILVAIMIIIYFIRTRINKKYFTPLLIGISIFIIKGIIIYYLRLKGYIRLSWIVLIVPYIIIIVYVVGMSMT